MTDFSGLEQRREEQTGQLVVEYNCHACGGEMTVIETWQSGNLIGECVSCGKHYVDPDWDAMGKEIV